MAKIKLDKYEKKKKDKVTVIVSGSNSKQHEVRPSDAPSEIDGYKVMKLKSHADSKATHHVLVKEHAVREKCADKPSNRTIYVRGVPPFVTEEALKNAFGAFGPIQNIYLHSSPCASLPAVNTSKFFTDVPSITGYKVAYIVYENEKSAGQVLLSSSDTPLLLFPDGRPPSLLLRLVKQYNKTITTNSDALKEEVDKYMTEYDRRQMNNEKEMQEKEENEEEDGWTFVTKKKGFARKESVHNKIMKKRVDRDQKTQLLNFYRFQLRESKMSQLVKLREKFEEDKKKIAQLKESRKFKPF